MASLPKKDGGPRTVAIASTIYRLLMEMDNEEVAQFEAANAFDNDSAKAGASAVSAAEDRALEAELERLEGRFTISALWDIKIFFDSIDVIELIRLSRKHGFPLRQLALSMVIHQAQRRLKLGKTIGECIRNLGRSILAGCKRSTHLARVYLLEMIKNLAGQHKSTSVYVHVDDISNLTKGKNRRRYTTEPGHGQRTSNSGQWHSSWRSLIRALSYQTAGPQGISSNQLQKRTSQSSQHGQEWTLESIPHQPQPEV